MNLIATPPAVRRPTSAARAGTRPSWPVPAALLALSFIPLAAGTLRLVQLAGGPAVIPADARFTGFPVALVVHIVGAAVFALVGILQFVPRFRRQHLTWHRRAGRVLAVAEWAIRRPACKAPRQQVARPPVTPHGAPEEQRR
jgi:hypothetical protein